jgi:two-component system sensor histidine kinase KdpD
VLSNELRRIAAQVALGVIGVALITALCFPAHLDLSIPSLLYLLLVVLQSLTAGFASAAVVSVIAVACLEYFFVPPILTWNVASPIDFVALATFLATSLVITRLASKARIDANSAESKRRDLAQLYELALRLLSLEPEVAAGVKAPRLFREIFDFRAACLLDANTAQVHFDGDSQRDLVEKTRSAYIAGHDYRDSARSLDVRCLWIGGELLGAIGFEGSLDSESTAGPLAMLAAVTLERARASESASKAAAAIHAEVLRSAILDALAHEFKTPLTAILTAAGSLKEAAGLQPDERELAEMIENETARLGRLTTRLLRMQRLDRTEVKPNLESTELSALVANIVDQYRAQSDDRDILVTAEKAVPVSCDAELLALAVVQLLDNASKYSRPGTAVEVRVDSDEESAIISVTNAGQPIRAEERERIFERFYRGRRSRHNAPGTGLGLYVARKIIRAQGGALEVDRSYADDKGTRFRLTLPILAVTSQHELKAS